MRYIITVLLASTPAMAEVPSVVTDIPPVHSLVAQVMGELGQPELLLAKGADEHDFQLRPSQAGAVADAGLVVWIGPELTPWLDSAMEARPEGAAALALLDAKGTERRAYSESDRDGHAADDGLDHEGHSHDGEDPHAWLDPGNAQVWLGLIADELSRLDPENAATYAANAKGAMDRVVTLEADLAALLTPVRDKPILTFHDAYGYFAAHYGLTLAGSITLGDAAAPGAAHLQAVRETLEAGAVVCVFPEVQHDPKLVEQMVDGTGVRVGGAIDPVGSSLEPGPEAYDALLRELAETIADCVAG